MLPLQQQACILGYEVPCSTAPQAILSQLGIHHRSGAALGLTAMLLSVIQPRSPKSGKPCLRLCLDCAGTRITSMVS